MYKKINFTLFFISALALAHCSGGDVKEKTDVAKEKTEPVAKKTADVSTSASVEEINKAMKKVTVEFPHNSDKPTKDLFPKESLRKITSMLQAAKIDTGAGEYIVVITGHASKVGTEKYNKQLAQRRAKYMLNWFADAGISRKAMKATNDGTKQNRRAVTFELKKR